MKRTEGGEIVQVEGGHIIRAIGKKDRHSKVITAKGPRDRRVRLSAHTAIQFYDVQDRLGYDRPSKAVDWLIKKAQNAIDKLAELPPWNPNENSVPELGSTSMAGIEQNQAEHHEPEPEPEPSSGYTFNETSNSSFMADSMRSFFPTSSGTSLMNFQNYSNDVMRRNSTQNEDLGLSLHTLQVDANYANNRNMGFIFSSQSISPYPIFGQNLAIPQRETLQSNYTNLIHAWNNHNTQAINQNSMSSSQFGASEYSVPARIQGDEEETGVLPVRSSLSPPLSRY